MKIFTWHAKDTDITDLYIESIVANITNATDFIINFVEKKKYCSNAVNQVSIHYIAMVITN